MKKDLNKLIGNLLQHYRKEAALKMEYVTLITGIAKSKLCKIENGQQSADVETICILCNTYNILPSNFFEVIQIKIYPPPLHM